jgi:hypothetical protein
MQHLHLSFRSTVLSCWVLFLYRPVRASYVGICRCSTLCALSLTGHVCSTQSLSFTDKSPVKIAALSLPLEAGRSLVVVGEPL